MFGDWNSRHPLWVDKVENNYGKVPADYCSDNSLSIISHHQPTFSAQSQQARTLAA